MLSLPKQHTYFIGTQQHVGLLNTDVTEVACMLCAAMNPRCYIHRCWPFCMCRLLRCVMNPVVRRDQQLVGWEAKH